MEIGRQHNRSAAQVALAWQIQRGAVVIPKTISPKRLAENFDVFFEVERRLSEDEMGRVGRLDEGLRLGWGGPREEGEPPRDAVHPLYPFEF